MNINHLDQNDPRVIARRADIDRLERLHGERAKKENELAELSLRNYERQRVKREDRLRLEAAALIGEAEAQPLIVDTAPLERHIEALSFEIEEQKAVCNRSQNAFDLAMSDLNREVYLAVARRIFKAEDELGQANQQEVELFRALADAGVHSTGFRPMRDNGLGTSGDPQSRANLHRREFERFLPEVCNGIS